MNGAGPDRQRQASAAPIGPDVCGRCGLTEEQHVMIDGTGPDPWCPDMPEAQAALAARTQANGAASAPQPEPPTPPTESERAFAFMVRDVQLAPPSERLATLCDSARSLRPFIEQGLLDAAAVETRIFEIADQHGLRGKPGSDTEALITSLAQEVTMAAFDDPDELAELERLAELRAQEEVAAMVARMESMDKPAAAAAKAERDKVAKAAETAKPQSAAMLGIWNAGARRLKPPPRGWLLGNQFCRGFLSSLDASGGTGKTALRTLQMLSMTTGRELTGEHVFKRCRVLAVSFEDGKEEQERRVLAAMLHHNIEPEDIDGWLYCWTPKGIKLAELGKEGGPVRGKLEKMLRDVIAELQIDLVSLDPFIKLHSLGENDNNAMDFVTDLLVQIAIDCQVGMDAPHHTKKGLQTAGDADAGRGAGAKRDAGRLGYTLTKMSEDEAKAFGIPVEQCRLYVRLDSGKVNIAPPSSGATWFKLVGVRLGNENDTYPAGDNVQTVERWHPPETWGGVTSAQLNAALTDIALGLTDDLGAATGRRFTEGNKTTPRSAWPIVQRHCPDRTEGQCREIIKTWIKNGVLLIEEYADPETRKDVKGLFVCDAKRPT